MVALAYAISYILNCIHHTVECLIDTEGASPILSLDDALGHLLLLPAIPLIGLNFFGCLNELMYGTN